jgi:hypothetical protein
VGVVGVAAAAANPLIHPPPAALPDLDVDMLLVAVGARGARNQIRNELATLRPDLVEGHNWWALL